MRKVRVAKHVPAETVVVEGGLGCTRKHCAVAETDSLGDLTGY